MPVLHRLPGQVPLSTYFSQAEGPGLGLSTHLSVFFYRGADGSRPTQVLASWGAPLSLRSSETFSSRFLGCCSRSLGWSLPQILSFKTH